ncbi:MAG: hypothetical protein KGH75_06280 [Rhodospirillales bacterium]|nr:hypothetical protein [Rhodospirillales bacterium]
MTRYCCAMRLIEDEPKFKRRAVVQHVLRVAPAEVAERVRKSIGKQMGL